MPAKKLPNTDEERIQALQTIIDREERNEEKTVLSLMEIYHLRNCLHAYENSHTCVRQASDDEARAAENYLQLFQNTQLYISHFIQVLYLATIRNEVKPENLTFYGLVYSDNFALPDLSTEEAVLEWGERLINGEAARTSLGGTAIYNPAITKVKVHYDLFKETVYSLKIYRQNRNRLQENLEDVRDKADSLIWAAWTKVEFIYGALPPEERDKKYVDYGIHFYYNSGEQLNVFS
ncbi:MAG: hypothetical protein LBB85_03960 [Dysgonamonadaceae bacterium]|jgi:hypothetical protein|nr:hypothetical protein [Dysgonamonadaceae bacterium]